MRSSDASENVVPVDSAKLQESMERLYSIFTEISDVTQESVKTRCPYKDASVRCHANFGCANQFFTRLPADLPVCTGSDKIDYRPAWRS